MYNVHNFKCTEPLTALALNEMDTQILTNNSRITSHSEAVDELDELIETYINRLDVSVNQTGYIDILYNDEVLSAVPIRDSSGYIPASTLTVSPSSLTIISGTTDVISASVSPINTSLQTRFLTSDRNVCRVDRSGTVVGVDLGKCVVYVRCGGLGKQVSVKCNRQVKASTIQLGGAGGWDATDKVVHLFSQFNNRIWTLPESGFIVPKGCKATVSLNECSNLDYLFNRLVVIKDVENKTAHLDRGISGMSADIVDCNFVYDSDYIEYNVSRQPIVYTNTTNTDVYLIISVIPPANASDGDELMQYMTCVVEKL